MPQIQDPGWWRHGNDKAPGDSPAGWNARPSAVNLVRSSEARKHVPKDLKLVELFGWTLGGVYLAEADAPAVAAGEMVALGGLVWNPPTRARGPRGSGQQQGARARRQDMRAPLALRRN